MPYSPSGLRSALVGGLAQAGDLLSVHTADPGTTGANEAAGVTRLPAGWGTPTGNGPATVDSDEVPFDVPGAVTLSHFGIWRADGTTFVGGEQLDEPETFSANGGIYNFTATLTSDDAP